MEVGPALLHQLLACIYIKESDGAGSSSEDAGVAAAAIESHRVLDSSVAGFISVKEVDMAARKIQVLSPCFGAMPSKHFVLGEISWMEYETRGTR